jgi:hypothetical protein
MWSGCNSSLTSHMAVTGSRISTTGVVLMALVISPVIICQPATRRGLGWGQLACFLGYNNAVSVARATEGQGARSGGFP